MIPVKKVGHTSFINFQMNTSDKILFERTISYPWQTVGFATPQCTCMSYKVSCNCEDFRVLIRIKETQLEGQPLYVAELINQPYTDRLTEKTKLCRLAVNSSTATSTTVEEAYMTARAQFLGCKCKDPENELYDLGYSNPKSRGFWATLSSWFS